MGVGEDGAAAESGPPTGPIAAPARSSTPVGKIIFFRRRQASPGAWQPIKAYEISTQHLLLSNNVIRL